MKKLSQIVALGGGGFSMEPDNPLLDNYILKLVGRRQPKICFLATASGDSQSYIDQFYKAFATPRAKPSHLPLFARDKNLDPAEHLLSQDIIYVGGGNTANLLAVWRVQGIDRILRRAWRNGIILCGISAGMNCWFEGCATDSFGKLAALNDGLGILPGSSCPHYNGQVDRRPAFRKLIAKGELPRGFGVDDSAAIHFIGRKVHAVISSRVEAKAYEVKKSDKTFSESAILTRFLG